MRARGFNSGILTFWIARPRCRFEAVSFFSSVAPRLRFRAVVVRQALENHQKLMSLEILAAERLGYVQKTTASSG